MTHRSLPPIDALRTLVAAWIEIAEHNEDVRRALLSLADWTRASLEGSSGVSQDPEAVVELAGGRRVVRMPEGAADDRSVARGGESTIPARELRPVDLAMVERRAAWKAKACRWAAERRRLAGEGNHTDAIHQGDEDLRQEREGLVECHAWMMESGRRLPDDQRLEWIAAAYENLARATHAVRSLEAEGILENAPPAELLYALAETQSALLAALAAIDLRTDSDQRDLFLWLKDQTTRHRIYVDRHMRLDDPAPFKRPADLAGRLDALAKELIARRAKRRLRGQLLNKVRYHRRKLQDTDEVAGYDWEAIVTAVEGWIDGGLPASDATLRGLVEPFAEQIAEELLPAAISQVVLRPVAKTDSPDEAPAAPPPPVREPEPEPERPGVIPRAAELLDGRRVTLFAREERADARAALETELRLGELRWVELGDEVSSARLEEEIARDETDLVLIAMRLAADDYATFKGICLAHERPFVRLPGGYGPGQVAHQVLRQVGRRLKEKSQLEA